VDLGGAARRKSLERGSKPRFRLFFAVCATESRGGATRGYVVLGKRLGGLGAGLFLASGLVGSARADCGSDMQKLAEARNTQLQVVNDYAKSFHGKPMDPQGFCAKSTGLVHAETALIAYMEKNKDWCSFPDDAINALKEHHAKNAQFNAKACTVAAQVKKMKEQAAQGAAAGPQAQPLPTGPL
jgi:hypothetical protein